MALCNLLRDTLEFLTKRGLTPQNVAWVGSADGQFAITWEEFTWMADRIYENNSDHLEVAEDLVIVGAEWWLRRERNRDTGCEGWIFCQKPLPELFSSQIECIFAPLDADFLLAEINFELKHSI